MVKQAASFDVTKSTGSFLRSVHTVRFALPFDLFYQSIGFTLVSLQICRVVDITNLKMLPHLNPRSTMKIFKWVKTKKKCPE